MTQQRNTTTAANSADVGGAEHAVSVSKIGIMNQLAEVGIDGVRRRLQQMEGWHPRVESELVKSGYVADGMAGDVFSEEVRAGVRIRLPGAPYGYALALLPAASANNAAAAMLERDVEDVSSVDGELAQSAVSELGSMMINGFIDEWADAFDQKIDVQPPKSLYNTEREIIRKTTAGNESLGVYTTSRLFLPEHDIVAQVYLFPETEIFVEIVNRVNIADLADS